MHNDTPTSFPDQAGSAADWIKRLDMQSHPEGGYYHRFYTSPACVETTSGKRPSATMIYYLLTPGDFSQWHRLRSDEIWQFQAGDPADVHIISSQGILRTVRVGPGNDQDYHCLIEADQWFAAEPSQSSGMGFTLVSCMVTPGFDFDDFELGNRETLSAAYPHLQDWFVRLCRN